MSNVYVVWGYKFGFNDDDSIQCSCPSWIVSVIHTKQTIELSIWSVYCMLVAFFFEVSSINEKEKKVKQ